MSATDKKIADVLAKFGEPMAGNVWRVQGTPVIYHKALERIAEQAGITFNVPTIIRAERDEAVMMVVGNMGERTAWSIGECLVGVNYRVSGKQAAYVFAMAEKRAKDRVILKLIELSGEVYSEEEADEFKAGRPSQTQSSDSSQDKPPASEREETAEERIERELRAKLDAATTVNTVTDLMLRADTQRSLADLEETKRNALRDYAKKRLTDLGWPTKKAS